MGAMEGFKQWMDVIRAVLERLLVLAAVRKLEEEAGTSDEAGTTDKAGSVV